MEKEDKVIRAERSVSGMPDREKVMQGLRAIKTYLQCQAIEASANKNDLAREAFIESQKDIDDAIELLKEQDAKTGHWVEQQINSYTRSTTCSVCGGSAPFVFVSADRYGRNGCGKDELTKYCPNCGAEMKGETEVEID